MAYQCDYCNKTYKNKKFFDKHYLKCQSLNNYEENEFEVLPSVSSIYKLVKHLVKENNQLKIRVNKLENKLRNKNSNKVNIIDWLNEQGTTILETRYNDLDIFMKKFNENVLIFWDNFNYTIDKLAYLSILDINLRIIKDILYHNEIFISFKDTKKIFYLKENKWVCLDREILYTLIQKIQKKMICDFMDFQTTNQINMDRFNNLSNKIYGNFNSTKNLDILYNKISNVINKEISKQINIKIIY